MEHHPPSGPRPPTLPIWRQLRWLLAGAFFLIAAIPLLAATGATVVYARRQMTEQVQRQLESVAELKEDQLQRWLADSTLTLDYLLTQPVERELLAALGGAADPARLDAINALLQAELGQGADGQRLFRQLIVYAPDGRVVAASDRSELGKQVNRQPYFAASLERPQTHPPYYVVGSGELTIVATRPILDAGGAAAGAIAAHLNLAILAQIMVERTGLSATGETYLVSQENNYLLTPSRFPGNPMNRAYRSQGIDSALRGEEGRGLYDDYRSPPVAVIGVYRWVPELRAALIAEVDASYAGEVTAGIALIGAGLALVAVLCAAAIGVHVAGQLTRPIVELAGAATRIARGDLGHRAAVAHAGEAGLLAEAFNTMAAQLQATLGGLEQRVAARTAELEQANRDQQRTLDELRASSEERRRLSDTIRELSSPVLPLLDRVLVMPLIGVIDEQRAATLIETLLGAIERHGANLVLLDVTGVPVIDTAVAALLLRAARAARMLGAETVLVGIRPEVAQTLVGLGMSLEGIVARADMQSGVRYALQRRA